MNPLTNVKNITKLNELELARGTVDKKSWHEVYKNSAWIFIGGLAYDLTEGDVLAVFSQYGEIVNINLVRDKKTGKTKGFCFLCYTNQKSTILAVDNFNGIKLCSRTIRVDHVENYKPPKEDDRDDDITRQLKSAGCAPKTIKTESLDSSAEKKKKKKAKKEKKKHKKDTDSKYLDLKIKVEKEDPGYDKHEQPKIVSDFSAKEKYTHRSEIFKSDKNYSDGSTSKAEFNLCERGESSKNYFEGRSADRGDDRDKHKTDRPTSKYINTSPERSKRKDHYTSSDDYSDSVGVDRQIINDTYDERNQSTKYKDSSRYKNDYHKSTRYRSSSEDRESNHRTEKDREFKRKHKEGEKHRKYDSPNSEEYQCSKSDKKLKTHRHHKESSSGDEDSQRHRHEHHSRDSSNRR